MECERGCKMLKGVYLFRKLSILLIFIIFFEIVCIKVPNVQAVNSYEQTLRSGIDSFPESYQVLLRKFVEETNHTNWNFQAYYTGISWDDFISAQAEHGRNRVHYSYDTIYRDSCNDYASGYYCADRNITAYFIDPRNFINQRNIFEFLEISYNRELYTKPIIEGMIRNYGVFNYGNPITFRMSDENHPQYGNDVTMTFADIIMEAADKSQMSPISIVIKIVQEVGENGSASTYGNYSEYPNCYNYFNIGAYDTGDAIRNGLKYADEAGWHCPYTSIVEGAEYNTRYYIQQGQNTLYFYKFDCVGNRILLNGETATVTSDNLYHQYMTNICDPYNQSATYFSTYTNDYLLNMPYNFIIPVFNDMPAYVEKPSTLLSAGNQELYYADVTSALYTRTGPGYGYNYGSIVLYKDDLVIMLDRKIRDKNGNEWDRVQFWNGNTGYVLSEYLEKYEKKDIVQGEPIVNSQPPEEGDPSSNSVIGYGYANVSSSLNVRQGPGTTYRSIGSLGPKEEVAILEELTDWYKIRTNNNLVGYASKEYIFKLDYARVEENIIRTIPETTADMVAKLLNVSDYTVKKGDEEITDNRLGTGYKFVVGENEYDVVVMGDVNGDAEVDVIDLALIKRYLMQQTRFDGVYKNAAKLQQNDSDIDVIDLALIKRHLMKTQMINV